MKWLLTGNGRLKGSARYERVDCIRKMPPFKLFNRIE